MFNYVFVQKDKKVQSGNRNYDSDKDSDVELCPFHTLNIYKISC